LKTIPNLIDKIRKKDKLYFVFGFGLFFILILISVFVLFSQKHSFLNSAKIGKASLFLVQGEEKKALPDISLVQNNSLMVVSPPSVVSSQALGVFSEDNFSPQKEVQEYIVQKGDTLKGIAQKFGISLETILWANDLKKNSIIRPGKKLIILPVSGVLHLVKRGDTLSEIASLYKVKTEEIIDFNGLSEKGEIFIGDLLVIPGGKMPTKKHSFSYNNYNAPLASSYFICPLPSPCKVTQGLHWYNAIDLSHGRCGEPIYAVANGTIQRTGYSRFYGYHIQILHPNKVTTLYAHLSKILVKPKEKVYQGQIIGYTGYTGRTIPKGPAGCHLHIEVRGAKNPFAKVCRR
jgi:murein DD-endopeptidase MepM/ murein hydrolase activator NlpD